MAAKNNLYVLITLLMISISSLATSESQRSRNRELISIPKHTDTIVSIHNILSNKNGGITLHCKSKDDDLGTHTVAPSAVWSFRFIPNFVGTTLFFCHVSAPGVLPAAGHYFDAYDQKRDSGRCPDLECCFNLYPTGPCRCNTDQCFPWTS